eukprot:130365_1
MMYKFAVFLNDNQISNSVCVQTPRIDVDYVDYSPIPPIFDSIKQFYDKEEKHVLIIWDFPQSVFGDKIKYEIQSPNKSIPDIISELPYKISTRTSVKNITLEIRTISIIDDKQCKG